MSGGGGSGAPGPRRLVTRTVAWALSFGCIIGCGSFVIPGSSFLPYAGPLGTAIAIAIGMVAVGLLAVGYRYLMGKFPVAGGAFAYTCETFGRNHAFVCGWFLSLGYLAIVPLNATALAIVSRSLLGNSLARGFSYSVFGYDIYAAEILAIVALLCVVVAIGVRSTRVFDALQSVFAVLLAASSVFVIVGVLASPVSSASNLEPVFSPAMSPALGVLAVVAMAPWAFVGFDVVSQVTDELAFPVRQAGAIMVSAIVLGGAVYIGLAFAAASVVPSGFEDWPSYVLAAGGLSGIEGFPLFNAVNVALGPVGVGALVVATVSGILTGMIGFLRATSRLLVAMADADVLPSWFGVRHRKHGTPVNALMFVFSVSLVASLIGRTALGWIANTSSAGAAIAFCYTAAATWKCARDEGNRAMCVVGALGFVLSALFLALLLVPVPALAHAFDAESYVFLIAWIVIGCNFFEPRIASDESFVEGSFGIGEIDDGEGGEGGADGEGGGDESSRRLPNRRAY